MAGWVSMKRASLLIAVLACHTSGPDRATPAPAGFVARTTAVDGATYRYQVFVPRHMGRARPPVILSLHGAGERGSDGELQTMVGLGPVVRGRAESFPAVVVFPQAPLDSLWRGAPARAALQALDASLLEFRGDSTRVYLTGLSMGGYGTWQLALEHPSRFAALVPVCGGVGPLPGFPSIRVDAIPATAADPYAYVATHLASTPVWLFHGAADRTVPPADSRGLAEALRRAGAPVRYTEYPGVGHNSWESAYNEPELWGWLWAQRLDRRSATPR